MDERLRELHRRWLSTQDPQDLLAWDAESQRSGYIGPIAATAINSCVKLSETVVSPDASIYSSGNHRRELDADWSTRSISAFEDGQPLVQDAARIEAVVKTMLSQPEISWQDTWHRERDGYPFFYEFSFILDVLIHASKHGLIYTVEEQAAIAAALAAFSGKSVLLCNVPHYHRRRGRVTPCKQPVLECQTNDCTCYYGDRVLNVCNRCHRRRTACVCEQFAEIQVGNAFGSPVIIVLHPDRELCQCHGGGWVVSDYDSIHQCNFHYTNQPHPEDQGFEQPSGPPLIPPLPSQEISDVDDDLPF